jgi:transposase
MSEWTRLGSDNQLGVMQASERQVALGLVPRQNSTGGKTRLGRITKRGNRYLRRLLINGASASSLRSKATKADPALAAAWARQWDSAYFSRWRKLRRRLA